jgi:hypothetical protein
VRFTEPSDDADPSGPTHGEHVRRRADPDDVSTTVVLAVADVLDEQPAELSPPLHELIDPGALDRLFADGGEDLRAEFTLYGCRVTVEADCYVDVRRTERTPPSA